VSTLATPPATPPRVGRRATRYQGRHAHRKHALSAYAQRSEVVRDGVKGRAQRLVHVPNFAVYFVNTQPASDPNGPFFPSLVEVDPTGALVWTEKVSTGTSDDLEGVTVLPNGNIISVGSTDGGDQAWVFATSPTGTLLWQQSYAIPGMSWGYFRQAFVLADGGLLLVGGSAAPGAEASTLWVVRTDSKGSTQWSRTYPPTTRESPRPLERRCGPCRGGYPAALVHRASGPARDLAEPVHAPRALDRLPRTPSTRARRDCALPPFRARAGEPPVVEYPWMPLWGLNRAFNGSLRADGVSRGFALGRSLAERGAGSH
jgi:hypothetical protein